MDAANNGVVRAPISSAETRERTQKAASRLAAVRSARSDDLREEKRARAPRSVIALTFGYARVGSNRPYRRAVRRLRLAVKACELGTSCERTMTFSVGGRCVAGVGSGPRVVETGPDRGQRTLTAYALECIVTKGSVEVITTDEFREWFESLSDEHAKATAQVVHMLEIQGTDLGYPRSSALKGTRYPLRELRVKAGGAQIRIAYAFDPYREAVLILGGTKEGDDRFYRWLIPAAERIWEQYLSEQTRGGQ